MKGRMQLFCVLPKDDDAADWYWVAAVSTREARRLVALNVAKAADAENTRVFDCVPEEGTIPPAGFIYRRDNGPVAIEKR